jgi:hypothetical protein
LSLASFAFLSAVSLLAVAISTLPVGANPHFIAPL